MTQPGDTLPSTVQHEKPEHTVIEDVRAFSFGKLKFGFGAGKYPVEEITAALYAVLQENQWPAQLLKVIRPQDLDEGEYRASTALSENLAITLPDGTEQRYWVGPIQIPSKFGESIFHLSNSESVTLDVSGGLTAIADAEFNDDINALFLAVEKEMQSHSIYHGKSIHVHGSPTLISLMSTIDDVNRKKIVYPERTAKELDRYLFDVIRNNPKTSLTGNENLSCSILLSGSYGTGKTSAAGIAAELCKQNGWTFVEAEVGDSMRAMMSAMKVARLHQPAVVHVEDIDAMASGIRTGSQGDSAILDFLDGLGKKSRYMVIMLATTNFPKRIPAGWLRPGRFDKLIQFGNFNRDRDAFKKLFRAACPADRLGNVNWGRLHRATRDLPPAFLRLAIDNALRMADTERLSTKDFLASADSPSFRQHLELATHVDDFSNGDRRSLLNLAMESLIRAYDPNY